LEEVALSKIMLASVAVAVLLASGAGAFVYSRHVEAQNRAAAEAEERRRADEAIARSLERAAQVEKEAQEELARLRAANEAALARDREVGKQLSEQGVLDAYRQQDAQMEARFAAREAELRAKQPAAVSPYRDSPSSSDYEAAQQAAAQKQAADAAAARSDYEATQRAAVQRQAADAAAAKSKRDCYDLKVRNGYTAASASKLCY
jgi:hypothetical protein